ncbi:hypothetical protein CU044_5352 [Streptomyces sp. L-9-10]|nr:hypothetical protein CU044_5352 [Streptomyces sp. L-9-10]
MKRTLQRCFPATYRHDPQERGMKSVSRDGGSPWLSITR